MDELRPDTTAAWIALAAAARGLTERIDAALKAAGRPPLAWYDALWELEKAGPDGLRPFALQDRLLLPQYGTSRLAQRLEAAGLVARAPCPGDGRGHVLRLTEAGRAARLAMRPVYAEALRAGLEARLSPGEAAQLAQILPKLR